MRQNQKSTMLDVKSNHCVSFAMQTSRDALLYLHLLDDCPIGDLDLISEVILCVVSASVFSNRHVSV